MRIVRYRLDDLGWYQFEWLIQSLLKAECGLGVESWGGRADYGRDAYSRIALKFPGQEFTDGPFLFQTKFIENANAAGATVDGLLKTAVSKEISRIKDRRGKHYWKKPKFYALITNAPVSADLRNVIHHMMSSALPKTTILIQGANDVSALLDKHENLRRSFPQLLSIRDLDALLQRVLNKEALERSLAAIECARDVVPVFVPTGPYSEAWKILREHNFVVLHGPPEMGKTAIAWMIATAQAADGWQAITCDTPEDFFKLYEGPSKQAFVADDAFGRTEYDPTRGKQWENQLERVIHRLDANHWLLWTSRKHILERACHTMDLQGKAEHFPEPSAVLVDASVLSTEEKALILYRHARAASLENSTKQVLRENARAIVANPSFTPERIRRFVKEVVQDLVADCAQSENMGESISSEINRAIQTPTDRMKKTYRALGDSQKMLLVSLLEAGNYVSVKVLRDIFETHVALLSDGGSFETVLDELSECFIKPLATSRLRVFRWMHPSYRDLVIDELASEDALRIRFLKRMFLPGIKLAISDAGGAEGSRRFPLMTDSKSWELLRIRSVEIISALTCPQETDLLMTLASATKEALSYNEVSPLLATLGSVCDALRAKWNSSSAVLEARTVETYGRASLLVKPLPPLPHLEESWAASYSEFQETITDASNGLILDPRSA